MSAEINFRVPVQKVQFGYVVVSAVTREEALQKFQRSAIDEYQIHWYEVDSVEVVEDESLVTVDG